MLESNDVPSGSHGESTPTLASPTSQAKRHIDDIEESTDYVVHDIEESEDYVVHDVLPPSESIPSVSEPRVHGFEFIDASGPASIFIPSRPTKTEWAKLRAATKSGFALTGVATLGQVGPHVGKADVGESEDDYMFRISLPGVKRDDGKLLVMIQNLLVLYIQEFSLIYLFKVVKGVNDRSLCWHERFS